VVQHAAAFLPPVAWSRWSMPRRCRHGADSRVGSRIDAGATAIRRKVTYIFYFEQHEMGVFVRMPYLRYFDAQKARVRDMRMEEWDTYDKGILVISNLTLYVFFIIELLDKDKKKQSFSFRIWPWQWHVRTPDQIRTNPLANTMRLAFLSSLSAQPKSFQSIQKEMFELTRRFPTQ
jgi:hypothetical protein